MSTTLAAEFQGGLDEFNAIAGVSVTIGTVTCNGIFDSTKSSETGSLGGFDLNLPGTLVVSKTDITIDPTIGQKIVVAGATFRVLTVDEDEVSYAIGLDNPSKR